MKARAIAVLGMVALVTLGLGGTRAAALSATPVSELRVEWETITRDGRTIVRGYVHNEYQMRAENVRLLIEGLDASARPVTTRTAYVFGTIPYRDRAYFEAVVPAAGAYRVSIESFDRALCGSG
jgi:hypothetical protein